MSVNPGFGGQSFIGSVLPKIRRAGELVKAIAPNVLLEVDGGVTLDNARSVAEAGAEVLVAGAAVFGSSDYRKTLTAMRAAIDGR